ncbi:Putative transferase At1g60990, chloroplastic [Linum perenne]
MEDEEERSAQQCNTFAIYHRCKSRNPTHRSLLISEQDFVMERLKPFMVMVVVQSVYTVMNVLYKLAEDDGMNLRILIAYRLVFATVFVTPLAVILERKKWPKLTWVVLFQGFLSGLFGASLSQTLYAESLALTSATFAAAISNLAPAITLLFAVLFRLESLSLKTGVGKAKVAGTMIGVMGATVLTFYKGVGFKSLSTNIQLLKPSHGDQNVQHQITGSHSFLGLLTGLGSCISYALWLIMQSKIGKTYQCCHYSSTALMSMMASIQSVCFCMFVEKDWSQWKLGLNVRLLAASFAGIVASGLAMIATVRIVEIRGPVFTSAFNPLLLSSEMLTALLAAPAAPPWGRTSGDSAAAAVVHPPSHPALIAFNPPSSSYRIRAPSFGISSSPAAAASSHYDLTPPPIDHDLLEEFELHDGARVSEDGVIETFGNDDDALDAFYNGVVVSDLSHFGRIRVSGDDRIQFLHNQSTANFDILLEGQKNSVLLMVSPQTCSSITQMLNKYIFFADKVEVEDITKKTSLFTLAGPSSDEVIDSLNAGDLVGQPYGTHRHYSVNGMPLTVGVGSMMSEEGYTLLMSPAAAGTVWKAILTQGAFPMGSNAWEKLRVIQGRPSPGKELTNEFNVLEAGLWNSISLNKGTTDIVLSFFPNMIFLSNSTPHFSYLGCYKGQETIARLVTYDGVKQMLWSIHLSAAAEPGSIITSDGKKARVGRLTSYTYGREGSNEHYGLGYIKRQVGIKGKTVAVGDDDAVGTLVDAPFLSRQFPPLMSSSS